MTANTTSSFNSTEENCREFGYYADIATTIAVAMASLSFLACLLVIVLIFFFKKHHFRPQRLILYLTIAVMINCTSVLSQKAHNLMLQSFSSVTTQTVTSFCTFVAYFSETSAWFELLAVTTLTVNLFLMAVVKRSVDWLEGIYLLVTFLLPLTFTWIPFLHEAYGLSEPWCWIRDKDEDCSSFIFGIKLQYALWIAPLSTIMLVLVILYTTVVYQVSKRNKSWDGNFNPMVRRMQLKMRKEVRPLIWYPLIYFLLHLVPLAHIIGRHFSPRPLYALWILKAIFLPLQGGIIALAFTLDSKTLRRLKWRRVRGVVLRVARGGSVREYPAEQARRYREDIFSLAEEEEEEEEEDDEDDEEEGEGIEMERSDGGRTSREHYVQFPLRT